MTSGQTEGPDEPRTWEGVIRRTKTRVQAAYLRTLAELERIHGFKLSGLLPDGMHRYMSTYCLHAEGPDDPRHGWCSATKLAGPNLYDKVGGIVFIARKPAQCKQCAAPCVCECHTRPTATKPAESDSK